MNGFLGVCYCLKCNKQLGGAGSGRPAESYAGTYTGLCYECEGAPDFVQRKYPLDGAKLISTPPSCPSWRRERETYTAYDDCESCAGKGYRWVSRGFDSYRHYCKPCVVRFDNHPLRKAVKAALFGRMMTIMRAAENRYTRELIKAAKPLTKKRKLTRDQAIELLGAERVESIRERVRTEGEKVLNRHEETRLYKWAASRRGD